MTDEEFSVAGLFRQVLEEAGIENAALRDRLAAQTEELIQARALQLAIEDLPLDLQTKIGQLPLDAQAKALSRELDDGAVQRAFGQAAADVIPESIRAAAEVVDDEKAKNIEQLLTQALAGSQK